MKILAISNLYPPDVNGGYELICDQVLSALAKSGHEVRVISATFQEEKQFYNREGVEVRKIIKLKEIKWPQPGERTFFPYLKRQIVQAKIIRKEIKDFSPDIIYISSLAGFATNILKEVLISPCKKFFRFGDLWLLQFKMYWNWSDKSSHSRGGILSILKDPLYYMIGRLAGSTEGFSKSSIKIDYARFPSLYLRNVYQQFLPEGVLWKVISNFVDCDKFFPLQRASKGKGKKLLFVGRISREKGAGTLLRALEMIKHEESWQICTFAGKDYGAVPFGNLSDELKGKTRFVGWVDNDHIPELMHQHDIFIFPSQWGEPFGTVAIQAMASGLPVIGTDDGGFKEVIIDGYNGIKFKMGDSQDLADKIKTLSCEETLWQRLSAGAREDVLARFARPQRTDEIEELLKEVYRSVEK